MRAVRPESLVVLVPGFLGLSQIGPMRYFEHIEPALLARLRRRGVRARSFVARPDPTGGLRVRAETLLDQLQAELSSGAAHKIHFVGHSAGGLDVRFALDPRFRLRERILPPTHRRETRARIRETLGARITIATPHRGTPFAVPFMWIGVGALESKLPLAARLALRLVRLGVKPDSDLKRWLEKLGMSAPMAEALAEQLGLHEEIVADARRAIEFVLSITEDRDGIGDLTPALLSRAARGDPRLGADGPHCSSILTFAPTPRIREAVAKGDYGWLTPRRLAFAIPWILTAHTPCHRDWPSLPPRIWRRLAPAGAPLPDERTNDGIIPTLSQPWGEVAGIFCADHLDALGQSAWLVSGAGFRRRDLSRLIEVLTDRIARAEVPRGPFRPPGA